MKLDYLDYDLSCDLTVWLNFAENSKNVYTLLFKSLVIKIIKK